MRNSSISTVVILMLTAVPAIAQDVYRLQNRWKENEFIHVEQPQPASGTITPGWLSAQWTLEPVENSGYYQIRNVWRNEFLHIQNGALECSGIQLGWWSAQWALEPVEGTSFVRIRNRWKPTIALHNQAGRLEAGPIDLGWWSAQWAMININNSGNAPQQSVAATNQNTAHQAEEAFTPQHNGTITTAYVRYEDQIIITGSVAIGNKVYFFPQQVNTNMKLRPNFDTKNPPICGQTFTIIQVSPTIKLDRNMPNLRNDENTHFKFIVEVF